MNFCDNDKSRFSPLLTARFFSMSSHIWPAQNITMFGTLIPRSLGWKLLSDHLKHADRRIRVKIRVNFPEYSMYRVKKHSA